MYSPFIKKFALTLTGLPQLRALDKASRDCVGTQNRILKEIIEDCKNTSFGREHNFAAIKTADEFKKAVPIRDFEGH